MVSIRGTGVSLKQTCLKVRGQTEPHRGTEAGKMRGRGVVAAWEAMRVCGGWGAGILKVPGLGEEGVGYTHVTW